MTIEETAQCLTILKTAYPYFYKDINKKEATSTLNLWYDMLKEYPLELVAYAIKDLIATHETYPPVIAKVINRARDIVKVSSNEPTNEELWHILSKAAANSTYGASEEFNRLPDVLKKYLGSPSELRHLASVDEEIFNSVTRSVFFKNIENVKERQNFNDRLPESTKKAIIALKAKMSIPSSGELTEEAQESRRNEILQITEG